MLHLLLEIRNPFSINTISPALTLPQGLALSSRNFFPIGNQQFQEAAFGWECSFAVSANDTDIAPLLLIVEAF